MSKKKLTNKQKKLYGSLIAVVVILVLALAKGKDLKQVVSNLVESGIDGGGLSEGEITDLLTESLASTATPIPPDTEKDIAPTDAPEATATVAPTATPKATATPEPTATPKATVTPEPTAAPTATPTPEPTEAPDSAEDMVEEDGVYSTPELVAAYLHTFHKLPSNFITKNEATKLGWDNREGNLWDVTDEMSIGGDRFGNYEKQLPDSKGRKWYECDVNYSGGYRGAERIVYSNDGLIYYTDDHYETFTQLY